MRQAAIHQFVTAAVHHQVIRMRHPNQVLVIAAVAVTCPEQVCMLSLNKSLRAYLFPPMTLATQADYEMFKMAGTGGDGEMAVEVHPGENRADGLSENPRPTSRRRISLITGPGGVLPIEECSAIRLVSTHDDVKSECIVNREVFMHEDEVQSLVFDAKSAEDLENYDFDLDNSKENHHFDLDNSKQDVLLGSEIDPRLAVPRHDEYEPQMTEDRLRELDDIADQHELNRLKKMGVLLPPETVNDTGGPIKRLSNNSGLP